MTTLKLTDLAAYKAYFEAIATSHVDIDGYKWGDKKVLQNDNLSDMPQRLLWATPYERAKFEDRSSDNIVKGKLARVAYLMIPNSELFADEDDAFEFCEAVIDQIIAKIYRDKRGAEVADDWQMIATRMESIVTSPVTLTLGSTRYIGWDMEITFLDNTGLEYNPAKWE